MAENMDRSYLTGFQPMLAKPPVDYMTRYSTFNYGPGAYESLQRADAALQIRQNAEARRRADIDYHDMMEGDEIASYLGGGGYEMDKGRLELYLREGSYDKARELADAMRARRDDNERSVFAWTKVRGSGEGFADAIATNALEFWGGKYLDDIKVNDVKGGEVSARVLLDGTSPEARDRRAQNLAKNLGVSAEAGRVLSDYTNPYYAVFSQLRNAAASGAALKENPRTAVGGRQITDQVKSAEPLYAEFVATHADPNGGYDESLGSFVKGMYRSFGGDIGSADLNAFYDLYRADFDRASGALDGASWASSMKGYLGDLVPKRTVPVSTGKSDKQGLPVYTYESQPVEDADNRRFVSLIGQTAGVLQSQNASFSTRTIAAGVGEFLQKEYELKSRLGVTDLAELGVQGETLPNAVAASLLGNQYQPTTSDAGRDKTIDSMLATTRRVANSLGYDQNGASSDPVGLRDLTVEVLRTMARSMLSSRPRALNDAVADTIADWFSRSGVPVQMETANRLATRIINNFNTGKVENLSTMMLDGDGDSYFAHNPDGGLKLDPNSGMPVVQSPEAKMNLVTGQPTKEVPTGDPDDLGNLTMDAKKLKASSTYSNTVRELKSMASSNDEAVSSTAQAILGLQRALLDGKPWGLGRVERYRKGIGSLMARNLTNAGVDLPSVTREFLASGRGLSFLQESDKGLPVSDGRDDLKREAWDSIEELLGEVSGWMADTSKVPRDAGVKADLLSRLLAEALNRSGVPLDSSFYTMIPDLGLSKYVKVLDDGVYQETNIGDLSDDKATSFLADIRSGLRRVLGVEVDGAFKGATGFGLGGPVGTRYRETEDHDNYGGILAKYQRDTWVPTVTEQAAGADKTPEVVAKAQQANLPSYNSQLISMLASATPGSEQEALVANRLDEALFAVTRDDEIMKELRPGLLGDLKKALRTGGLAAARDYLRDFSDMTLTYAPVEAERPSLADPTKNKKYLRYVARFIPQSQLDQFMREYRLTKGTFPAKQQEFKVLYKAQLLEDRRYDDALNAVLASEGKRADGSGGSSL